MIPPHSVPAVAEPRLRYGTAPARWVLAATVLGSGIVFLDGTVVQVALPAISSDLGGSFADLQWTINGYLVTLSALILLGGSLGDRFGRRRIFTAGLAAFVVASLMCALAPSPALLIAARTLQGAGGALLVPSSLAIIAATFHPDDRSKAIGAWSGLAAVASAAGPFLGGWLVDSVSWRLVFLINVPLATAAIWIAGRHVPETRTATTTRLDIRGAALITASLAAISYAAIERSNTTVFAVLVGAIAAVAFVVVEHRSDHPMLPVGLFASRQFTGANVATVAIYAGLGGAFFLVVLRLQWSLDYSALAAGAALVPFTLLLLVLSSSAGRLGQRVGVRAPMTAGPLVAAAGIVLLSRIAPGDRYATGVLPGVVIFGLGIALTVAPLTAAVFAGVSDELAGFASGINNAAARFAGLVAVAAVPLAAGISTDGRAGSSLDGFASGMRVAAGLTALGGGVAFVTLRETARVRPLLLPVLQPCNHPAVRLERSGDPPTEPVLS